MSKQTPSQTVVTRAARNLMTKRAWSQSELAEVLGFSTTTMSHRLNGYRRWTLEDVDRLALLGAELPVIGEEAVA